MKDNVIYYFLSTAAQVWAALVAFGGIAIRDRIERINSELDQFFRCGMDWVNRESNPIMFGFVREDRKFANRTRFFDHLNTDDTARGAFDLQSERAIRVNEYRIGYNAKKSLAVQLSRLNYLYLVIGLLLTFCSLAALVFADYLSGNQCEFKILVVAILLLSLVNVVVLVKTFSVQID